MIKQVEVCDLRPGMFLHRLGNAGPGQPFRRQQFRLRSQDIDAIRRTGFPYAWIDTELGMEDPSLECTQGGQPLDTENDAPVACDAVDVNEFDLDLEHAAVLCTHAKAAVARVFDEVRTARAIDTGQCTAVVEEIVTTSLNDPAALIVMALLKDHDDYTLGHCVSVCALMTALSGTLGFSRQQMVEAGVAGLLHDIGKAFVPAEILSKPAALSPAEYALVQTHTSRGHKWLLESVCNVNPTTLDVCLHHHERVGGSGYPHGLTGDSMSIFAKMAAICDAYDALTSDRPYKRGVEPGRALRTMAVARNHFDPLVFQAFVKTVGIYPVGTLVRLRSEMLAVVVGQDESSLLRPHVRVFYSLGKQQPVLPRNVSLVNHVDDAIVNIEAADDFDIDLSLVRQMWAPAELRF